MIAKHYRKELPAYLDHELAPDARARVAEHLLRCADCRREFEQIKLGAALAARLPRADATPDVWRDIEKSLDEKEKKQKVAFPRLHVFKSGGLAAAGLCLIALAATLAYYSLFKSENHEIAETPNSNFNIQTQTKNPAVWSVEAIDGTPRAGNVKITGAGNLAVGETLETDAASRALIAVADIGSVEIQPDSRVKMVNTSASEHRLALERGILRAQIFAPPRLFVVDTPSGRAIDLGCAYTLEVDRNGDNRLHVTSGYVALAEGNAEVIVPAGAVALAKRGVGLGTPFAADSPTQFQNALYEFDFENGGNRALQKVLKNATRGDALTLWHLLARAPENERGKVFDWLARRVKPPASVTRRGALKADKEMLDAWFVEVENAWFERYLD